MSNSVELKPGMRQKITSRYYTKHPLFWWMRYAYPPYTAPIFAFRRADKPSASAERCLQCRAQPSLAHPVTGNYFWPNPYHSGAYECV